MAIEGFLEREGIVHKRIKSSRSVSERSHSISTSVRKLPKHKLVVGDQIMVFDSSSVLEPAKVIEVRNDEIKIHYTNWNSQWDEWLSS